MDNLLEYQYLDCFVARLQLHYHRLLCKLFAQSVFRNLGEVILWADGGLRTKEILGYLYHIWLNYTSYTRTRQLFRAPSWPQCVRRSVRHSEIETSRPNWHGCHHGGRESVLHAFRSAAKTHVWHVGTITLQLPPMCAMPGIQSRYQFWLDARGHVWYRPTCKQAWACCVMQPDVSTEPIAAAATATDNNTNNVDANIGCESLRSILPDNVLATNISKPALISRHQEQVRRFVSVRQTNNSRLNKYTKKGRVKSAMCSLSLLPCRVVCCCLLCCSVATCSRRLSRQYHTNSGI